MFALVLPFYNGDWRKLIVTVPKILSESAAYAIEEIILAHNGPAMTDDCRSFCERAATQDPRIRWFHTNNKGIGAGYKLGIQNARAPYVVLSASDLPFGWTDIQSFPKQHSPQFAIGSKAHAQSKIEGRSVRRRISTSAFYWLRRALLGARTPEDSQGSLIIERELALRLARQSEFDHYLCSLELATLALKEKVAVVELPVQLQAEIGDSAVSVASDGMQMVKDIFRLRARVKR